MVAIDSGQENYNLNEFVRLEAALESLPRSKGKMARKAISWWTEECSKAVRQKSSVSVISGRSC